MRARDPDVTAILSSLESNAGSAVLARVSGEWFSGSVGSGPESLPDSLTDAVSQGVAGHQRARIDGVVQLAIGVPITSVDTWYFELVPMDDIDRTLGGLVNRLVAGAAVAAVVAAVLGWFASGRVLRPLRRFAGAAERIADGALDTRLHTGGDRDLGALERTFNRMASAVQERVAREARFTSDVSHELRSPVAGMLSAISVARRAKGDAAVMERTLDALDERVQLLHTTVEDLLEISRVEAGVATLQLEPVDPVRLAEAVLARMNLRDVPISVAGAVVPVELDKRRVGQMLQNLLENAERYGGGATRVEIEAASGLLRLAVEDDGPGVPDHERSYIFERFARGDSASSSSALGSGLGLALVSEHASLHGGRVVIEERTGGARFVVELPMRSVR